MSSYISDNPVINPPSHRTEQKEVARALLVLLEAVIAALSSTSRTEELAFLADILVNTSVSYRQAVELTHGKI